MSALAGRWNFDGRPDAESSCARMLAAQRIYGPHDERRWSDGFIAMGRRLYRILPEDRFDRQPLHSADGGLVLVADLRLDNREDLYEALGLAGAEAARLCDAAVLLHALERWGEEAVERIVGDFAFALWDRRARRLMLACDFLGHRPLHYHSAGKFLAFATMPKGLHALAEIPYAADAQAIAEFLTGLPEAEGRSFFRHVSSVEPGHVLTITADGQRSRRFWNPDRQALARPPGEDFVEGLRHHLDEATRARLRGTGGRVASELSGGWDSGAVTATAARLLAPEGGTVTAFTAVPREGYGGAAPDRRIADEGPLAAATAALHPNVDHVLIRAGHVSPVANLDRYFHLFDRPYLNLCNGTWGAAINESCRARQLSVLLSGQMGNMTISYPGTELLPELVRSGKWIALARTGAQLVAKSGMSRRAVLATALGPFMPAWLWKGISRIRGRDWALRDYSAIHPDQVDAMELGRLARERKLDLSLRPRGDGFETRIWVLRRGSFGNYHKGILAGWGIDYRDPTADQRLVEYCLGVPMQAFLADGELRALPRRALADRLPAAVLDERAKGYQAADWHEGLTAARDEVEAEVNRFADCALAAQTLDVARLRALFEAWPESGWERPRTSVTYRALLLRGVSGGHFLRKASGANR